MIFLEIAMLFIGLGAVIYSFRLAEEKMESEKKILPKEGTSFIDESASVRLQEKLQQLQEKAEILYEETDDKISQLSNEKIMGMNEYSDQVLDKIEKNHGEVVFLYDMMNAKQEEIKELIGEIDSIKADLHDEAAREFQKLKEQEKVLEEIRKEIELDSLEYQSQKEELQEEWEALEKRVMEEEIDNIIAERSSSIKEKEETEQEEKDSDEENGEKEESQEIPSSIFDAEIARIEEQETQAMRDLEEDEESLVRETSSEYQPLEKQEKPVNHNDEIIQLYKKGRSILDISKMLALGQGEVKFVIDLYNAR